MSDLPFKASTEVPQMKALAVEHLETCRACNQRTASHHMGVGEVYTDVQIGHSAEIAANSVKYVNEMIQEGTALLKDLRDKIDEATRLISEAKVKEKELSRNQLSRNYKIGGVIAIASGYILTVINMLF